MTNQRPQAPSWYPIYHHSNPRNATSLFVSRVQFRQLASEAVDLPAELSDYVGTAQVLECACRCAYELFT